VVKVVSVIHFEACPAVAVFIIRGEVVEEVVWWRKGSENRKPSKGHYPQCYCII